MTSSTPEPGTPASRQLLTRRNLIASTGLVAAAVSAAPLLGRGTAEAAVAPACPPGTTAPVPPPGQGPGHPQVRVPGRGNRRADLPADRRPVPDDVSHDCGGRGRGACPAHYRAQHPARYRERDQVTRHPCHLQPPPCRPLCGRPCYVVGSSISAGSRAACAGSGHITQRRIALSVHHDQKGRFAWRQQASARHQRG